jgi:hypothetical protein
MKLQKNVIFEFADVRIENTWILDKVTKHIERSDFGLFDITFLNPNVLLELGIALGMKKRSHIFLNSAADERSGFFSRIFATRTTSLPVNLQGLELVQYSTRQQLMERLLSLSRSLSNTVEPSTLNHSYRVRQAVLEIVKANPGLRISEIETRSGETIEFVKSALQRLRKDRLICTEGRSSGTRYFAVAVGPSAPRAPSDSRP